MGTRETKADRATRLGREQAIIAKAGADIDTGLDIEDDDVEKWSDLLAHDPAAPVPAPK